jgi:hypothetical protein
MIKKYAEYHSLFISLQNQALMQQLQHELQQGLWLVCPNLDEAKRIQVVNELLNINELFITKKCNIQDFHTKYIVMVKEVQ